MDQLESKGQVNVTDLSEQFSVSEVTIRNDFLQLEKKNMLIRARGGAIKVNRVGMDFELSKKQKIHFVQKQKIGKRAAKLIQDGDTIIIDSGTTTQEIIKNMSAEKNLTVITNALNIASILSEYQDFNIYMPGGVMRKKSLSLVGALASENFKKFYCDKLFLGVDGFDTLHGLSTPNTEEAHLNSIMIEMAKKVIVVSDSRKFSRRRFGFIGTLSKIHVVITDTGIKAEDKARLENQGIEVTIV